MNSEEYGRLNAAITFTTISHQDPKWGICAVLKRIWEEQRQSRQDASAPSEQEGPPACPAPPQAEPSPVQTEDDGWEPWEPFQYSDKTGGHLEIPTAPEGCEIRQYFDGKSLGGQWQIRRRKSPSAERGTDTPETDAIVRPYISQEWVSVEECDALLDHGRKMEKERDELAERVKELDEFVWCRDAQVYPQEGTSPVTWAEIAKNSLASEKRLTAKLKAAEEDKVAMCKSGEQWKKDSDDTISRLEKELREWGEKEAILTEKLSQRTGGLTVGIIEEFCKEFQVSATRGNHALCEWLNSRLTMDDSADKLRRIKEII